MTAIGYASATEVTEQTHTGDTTWTDALEIADADIVDSAEYLLIVTAQINGNDANETFGFRVVIGTTPTLLAGSNAIIEPYNGSTRPNYMYVKKFTASASAGENIIKFQIQTISNTAKIVKADTIVMVAINLDTLDAADWFYGEDDDTGTPIAHTTSFVDFATTGEFTPANTNDDWLVLFCTNTAVNVTASSYECRLRLDGTTASPTDDAPLFNEEGEDTSEQRVLGLSRVHTLSAAAHQFWVQSRDDSGGGGSFDHRFSAVFALRLNAFQDHAFVWTEAELTLTTDNVYEEIAAIAPNISPVTSDVIVIGSAVSDCDAVAKEARIQATVGGTVTPTGRDKIDSKGYDATDENPLFTMFVLTSQSGALDLDLDGQVSSVSDSQIEDRSFVAFSTELAAVAGGTILPQMMQHDHLEGRAAA